MRKSVFSLLSGIAAKPTPEETAAAKARGVDVMTYRHQRMLELVAEKQQEARAAEGMPPDVAAETDKAEAMRREPGLFKPRNEAPNVLVQAAETPGEVAKVVLFVFLYLAGMIALVVLGGERVQKLPGIFQCGLLALLIIPVWWLMNRIWYGIGEGARDVCRALVRFWPVTLVLLLFALGGLRLLFERP